MAHLHPQLHLRLRNSTRHMDAVVKQLQRRPLHPRTTSPHRRQHRLARVHIRHWNLQTTRRSLGLGRNTHPKLHEPTRIYLPIRPPQSTTLEKKLLMFSTEQGETCGYSYIPHKPTLLEQSKRPHPRRMLGMARLTTRRQLRTVIRTRKTPVSTSVLILPSQLLLPTSCTPQM